MQITKNEMELVLLLRKLKEEDLDQFIRRLLSPLAHVNT